MVPKVAIARVKRGDIETAIRQVVTMTGGLKDIIRRDSKVLVKPNLCEASPSGSGIVTNAQVTEAVTKIVMELGPRSVVIGEGSVVGYDMPGKELRNSIDFTELTTEKAFEISGTLDVARRLGVEVRNLNRDSSMEVKIPQPYVMETVKIARTALESDVIISIPVLKTHIRTLITLSLKNMKGVMPGPEKRKTHRLGLDLAIVDLNSVMPPTYAVIDATVGMQGLWQYPQDCRKMGLVIAGQDALSVDIIGSWLMGINPKKVMHLHYFALKRMITTDVKYLEIVGEPLEKHRKHFKDSFQAFAERYPEIYIVQGESACSGCTNGLVGALRYMKEAGFGEKMTDLTIIIGNAASPKATEKVVVLGRCASNCAQLGTYESGCPPEEAKIISALCEACRADFDYVIAVRDKVSRKLWDSSDAVIK